MLKREREFEEPNEERIDAVLYLIEEDDSWGEKNCSCQIMSVKVLFLIFKVIFSQLFDVLNG